MKITTYNPIDDEDGQEAEKTKCIDADDQYWRNVLMEDTS